MEEIVHLGKRDDNLTSKKGEMSTISWGEYNNATMKFLHFRYGSIVIISTINIVDVIIFKDF